MRIEPPKIDPRRFSDLVGILRELVPHYTPEWVASDEKDAGYALIRVFSHITEAVINRFNQVPRKNLVAFLDMLGINLLPAQPARVPITFRLAKGTDRDTLIPARIQAAADKTEEHDELPFETEGSLLATISNLREVISVDPLKDGVFVHTPNVVSKDGEVLEEQVPFTLFSGDNRQEHALYLGHKELFNMENTGEITLEVDLAPGTEVMGSALNLRWEYWGEDKEKGRDDWIALQVEEDETGGFNRGGRILLLKTVEGKVKEEKLEEVFKKTSGVEIKDEGIKRIKTRWLRCILEDPLPPDSSIGLPTIDTVFLRTRPSNPIPPDAGYFNDVPLDWTPVTIEAKVMKVQIPPVIAMAADTVTVTDLLSVDSVEGFRIGDEIRILRNNITQGEGRVSYMGFASNEMRLTLTTPLTVEQGDVIRLSKKTTKVFPFGNQPRLYDAFYIGSQEAFSKKGAAITLYLSLARFDTSSGLTPPPAPKLSWEYWDGKGWQAVTVLKDDTDRFLEEGEGKAVEFKCPQDIEETEISGQKNYWVRARIVGGDYGRDEYTVQSNGGQKVNVERKYNLPIIRDLRIGYYFDIKEGLQHCLTYNNLDFQDKTSDSKGEGKAFQPFIRMEDTGLNLYMGFDRALTGGPIRLFFAAKEIPYTEETKPKMDWNYRDKTGWGLLDFLDETEGLIVQGHLEVIGPSDFTSYARFGRFLYWIRGSLVKGTYEYLPEVGGVYPNTTWALQAETIRDEILGSSDGEPSQTFSLLKFPVIEGQEIRVREVLSEEEKQGLIASLGDDVVFEVKDEKGKVIETWVLWTEVPDLFDSKPDSRHYTLDRATGRLRFGDGINGMIPPGGDDNIKAFSYQAGGGAKGNVKTGEIKTLKSAVPGVDKVVNNVDADGGADTATLEEMIEIGPAMISHRSRAVTVEDFEWLAKLASRKVVKARCLPNTNDKKQAGVGWVTVIIVPDSPDPKPFPSLELRRGVRRFLEAHSASTLGSVKHIYVDGPLYVEVGVSADVFVTSIDVASEVERETRRKLNGFFHPLTGGPEGKGWDFGRDVSASDVYALLEGIEGVDHVENLRFTYNKGTTSDDTVEIKRDYLVSSGVHSINLRLRANGQINTGNEV
ncbi:MAG TPA: putative baseplate assembly protein [Thermodesulfobacteriota bacterium]|nr:putative baseplate assembly protein [Thermodesulfobacteriota bacterium]